MNDGYRHSICRKCWNKRRPRMSSVGHETPVRFRESETCCFCLERHKSGIHVAKNPKSTEIQCGGIHTSN